MSPEPPIPVPIRQRLVDLRRGPLSLAVWILALAAVSALLVRRGRGYEHLGLAQALEHEVSSPSTGVVAAMAVELFEEVEAGQVLAVLDESELAARLATERAELARLQGELAAEAARGTTRAADIAGELRSFQVDEERLRLDLLELRVELEESRVEKVRLDLRAGREERLAAEGLSPASRLDEARLERDALARRITESETLAARTEEEVAAARQRRESFEARFRQSDPDDPVLAPLRQAVAVQESRLAELELERHGLVLKSPVAGWVSEVKGGLRQVVLPGAPLVVITQRLATEVIAYLPESSAPRIPPGSVVVVAASRASAVAKVERIGPSVTAVPQQLWRSPSVPEYALPVLIRGVESLALAPGERVFVRLGGNPV